MNPPRCGTYAKYQRHNKAGEEPCARCRRAARDYLRQYREKHPDYRRRMVDLTTARQRAALRVAHRYPGVFALFLEEELGT